MSQSGYTPISLYTSTTTTNVPLAGNLVNGELAINITDGKLFYKDNAGVVQIIASKAGNVNVSSISFGSTGLTPSTATTGAVTVAGTLITSNGGTGLSSYTAGDLPYYASGTALSKLGIGTSGQVLTSSGTAPQWATLSGVAVTTFQTSLSGLTPSTATSGAVTLAGTLGVASGGTGLTSLTAGYIPYGNGTSAFGSSANLYFDGTNLSVGSNTAGYGTLNIQRNTSAPYASFTITDQTTSSNTIGIYLRQTGSSPAGISTAGAPLAFYVGGPGTTEAMRIDSSGNVGIGTSSPAAKLDVNGAITMSAAAATKLSWNNSGAYLNWIECGGIAGNNYMRFATGNAEAMRIDTSGNVGIGTSSPAYKLHVSSTGLNIIGSEGTTDASFITRLSGTQGLYIHSTTSISEINELRNVPLLFSTNATERMRITSTGNVGIGTTSPSALLTVNGDASISGLTVGKGGGAVSTNTAIGASALAGVNTGTLNTGVGQQVLYTNTSGAQNTAIGGFSLYSNTTGSSNTAVGAGVLGSYFGALGLNTTGSSNTAIGQQSLYSNTTASGNTAVGYQAANKNTTGTGIDAFGYLSLYNNTTGTNNSSFGTQALSSNTTGSNNTAHGFQALPNNTTASNNTAVGYKAAYANTTGTDNNAFGRQSLQTNTTGNSNNVFGSGALGSNTTGSNNCAFGESSLAFNTTASNNTAVGYQAGYSNSTGTNNFFGGFQSGYGNTTGSSNTAIGWQSLYSNTTGGAQTAVGMYSLELNTGAQNTAIGYSALGASGTGGYNTAVGFQALQANTSAANNVAVGYQAGFANTTGAQNTFIGRVAGYSLTTGTYNTFVGDEAGYYITTGGKNVILGTYNGNQGGLDIRTASNYIVLSDGDGNPRQVIDSSGNVGIGTSSPTQKLDVVAGGGYIARFYGDASNYLRIYNGSGYQILESNGANQFGYINTAFFVQTGSGSEAMRIDSSGNVGIGTSSPNDKLEIKTDGGTGNALRLYSPSTTNPSTLLFTNNYSSAAIRCIPVAATLSVDLGFNTAGAERMRIDSSGNLGLGVTPSAWNSSIKAFDFGSTGSIYSVTDAVFAHNGYVNAAGAWTYKTTAAAGYYQQFQGKHVWFNAPSGTAGNAITFTQAMTLDNSGNLLVGTTSVISSSLVNFKTTSTSQNGLSVTCTATTGFTPGIFSRTGSDGTAIAFNRGGSDVGTISITTTATAYNTSSDQRLKENIVDAPSGNIDDIKVRSFDWKSDGSHQEYGMVAQELVEVAPYAVHQPQDTEEMMAVDYSKLVPMMIKEIQDLKKEIALLKAKQ